MPIDVLTALGQKMQEARKNKELTQQELSDLSHISVKQIANIENKKLHFEAYQSTFRIWTIRNDYSR